MNTDITTTKRWITAFVMAASLGAALFTGSAVASADSRVGGPGTVEQTQPIASAPTSPTRPTKTQQTPTNPNPNTSPGNTSGGAGSRPA